MHNLIIEINMHLFLIICILMLIYSGIGVYKVCFVIWCWAEGELSHSGLFLCIKYLLDWFEFVFMFRIHSHTQANSQEI